MENRIVIIDGNSLMNRAYYALKRPMITREGIHTGAIYGFINMLEKIKKDYEPGYICVAFDVKAPTFRHTEFSDYKATRKPMAIELKMQMPLIKDVLKAMNILTVEMEGFEADDLIGTIASRATEEGLKPLIITGDRDALQLADDNISILYTIKGISQFKIYDRDTFYEEYGFEPVKLVDYKALVGDTSDNIPGVAGIGKVAATKLIKQYGYLENMLSNIETITPPGVRNKLENGIQEAVLSKRLAMINRNVPIEIDLEKCKYTDENINELSVIYKKLEFNSFLKKMKKTSSDIQKVDVIDTVTVDTDDIADNLLKAVQQAENIGLKVFSDNNHLRKPDIRGIGIFDGKKLYMIFDEKYYDTVVKTAVLSSGIWGHNLKDDYYNLMFHGIFGFNTIFDTAVAEYVLNPSGRDFSIEKLAGEYLDTNLSQENVNADDKEGEQLGLFLPGSVSDNDDIEKKRITNEAVMYFSAVKKIVSIQKNEITVEKLENVLYEAELPLVEVMAYMEFRGFKIDTEYLTSLGKEFEEKEKNLESEIFQLAGEKFNIRSPQQLGIVLFEKMGLPSAKKTKTGYATGAEILEKLKNTHPIIPAILQYRKMTKLRSTYIDGLKSCIAEDGKIHCSFNQTVTTTGRISSSNPNMQNIPIREEEGRKIRRAFVPSSEKYSLIGADYSQIELRILAHLSGDESLIEAFNNEMDIHKATAARVMGVPENEITAEQRSRAKAINFGVIYGMSSFGLSEELHITRKDAEQYIDEYFRKHEKVKIYMDEKVKECRHEGYVSTILGRKRRISEISASSYNIRQLGERLAMNTPIQGSAADIIKLAMIKVYSNLKNFKSSLILQIHDELIIELHEDEKDEVREILRKSMEDAFNLKVKLTVDIHEGSNWMELK